MAMKKAGLIFFSILLVGLMAVSGINAFEKGKNRIANGDFESGSADNPLEEWTLAKGG
jgi:hypothetical protein